MAFLLSPHGTVASPTTACTFPCAGGHLRVGGAPCRVWSGDSSLRAACGWKGRADWGCGVSRPCLSARASPPSPGRHVIRQAFREAAGACSGIEARGWMEPSLALKTSPSLPAAPEAGAEPACPDSMPLPPTWRPCCGGQRLRGASSSGLRGLTAPAPRSSCSHCGQHLDTEALEPVGVSLPLHGNTALADGSPAQPLLWWPTHSRRNPGVSAACPPVVSAVLSASTLARGLSLWP